MGVRFNIPVTNAAVVGLSVERKKCRKMGKEQEARSLGTNGVPPEYAAAIPAAVACDEGRPVKPACYQPCDQRLTLTSVAHPRILSIITLFSGARDSKWLQLAESLRSLQASRNALTQNLLARVLVDEVHGLYPQ